MIREKPITGPLLWIYAGQTDDPLAPFLATVAVDYDADGVPWLRGMQGAGFARPVLRELAEYFHARGVPIVKAKRMPGHRLPSANVVDGVGTWDVAALLTRVRRSPVIVAVLTEPDAKS